MVRCPRCRLESGTQAFAMAGIIPERGTTRLSDLSPIPRTCRNGKREAKCGSAVAIIAGLNSAAVIFDDSTANGEPHSQSSGFGGKE